MDETKENNIINIIERGNRLSFEDNYTPIVCGNSNYYLKFDFEGDWLKCIHKTAIFIVEGKKFALDFVGDTAKVPALPNATHFHVALTSSYDENTILNTTAIRIRLEPTPLAADMSEFNPVSGYLSKMIGVLNKIQSGEFEIENVKFAENSNQAEFAKSAESAETAETANNASYATVAGSSETQVDLSSDQTISGVKTFVGDIVLNGKSLSDMSSGGGTGQNLILNSNFLINQRRRTEYVCFVSAVDETVYPIIYTVDRWKGFHGLTVTTAIDGVIVSNSGENTDDGGNIHENAYRQFFEAPFGNFAGFKMALSCKVDGVYFSTNFTVPSTYNDKTEFASIDLGNHGGEANDYFKFGIDENGLVSVYFEIASGSNFKINYVKLEYGKSATEYIPPIRHEELTKCYRYYVRTHSRYINFIARGLANGFNNNVQLPVEMRIAPVVAKVYYPFPEYLGTLPEVCYVYDVSDGYVVRKAQFDGVFKNNLTIRATPVSDTKAGEFVTSHTYSGAVIADAEFYTEEEIGYLQNFKTQLNGCEVDLDNKEI